MVDDYKSETTHWLHSLGMIIGLIKAGRRSWHNFLYSILEGLRLMVDGYWECCMVTYDLIIVPNFFFIFKSVCSILFELQKWPLC